MEDGFNLSELDNFTKQMLSNANDFMPKESKKFIKKEAGSLNKVNKKVYKSKAIGLEPDDTPESKKIVNRFKSGKAYKYEGNVWSARAYNSANHAHLIDQGFIHKPHKGQHGQEKFIPGYHFMESAASEFESTYYKDCENFTENIAKDLTK